VLPNLTSKVWKPCRALRMWLQATRNQPTCW